MLWPAAPPPPSGQPTPARGISRFPCFFPTSPYKSKSISIFFSFQPKFSMEGSGNLPSGRRSIKTPQPPRQHPVVPPPETRVSLSTEECFLSWSRACFLWLWAVLSSCAAGICLTVAEEGAGTPGVSGSCWLHLVPQKTVLSRIRSDVRRKYPVLGDQYGAPCL